MANTRLTRTFSSGSGTTFTTSFWVKRTGLGLGFLFEGYGSGTYDTECFFNSDDTLHFRNTSNSNYTFNLNPTRKFRDVNSWYHLLFQFIASGDSGVYAKIYVNGIQETVFTTNTQGAGGTQWNNTAPCTIGASHEGNYNFNGIISHFHHCDGTALAPTVFGETDATTGEWKIKTSPTFTLGTNGFTILKDGNTITDQSSNSNDWSLGGGTLTKTEDCPDNVFATMNSLDKNTNVVLTNGNTTSYSSANNTWVAANKATLGIAKDKFYWEMKITGSGTANGLFFGVCADTVTLITSQGIQDNATEKAKGVLVFCDDGQYQLDTNSRASMTSAPAFNDVLGCAVDRDNNTVKFYKNGSEVGSINISSSPLATCSHIMPFMINFYTNTKFNFNFGNGAFGTTQLTGTTYQATGLGIFKHQPPSGYTALCTKGLNL